MDAINIAKIVRHTLDEYRLQEAAAAHPDTNLEIEIRDLVREYREQKRDA